ncbi:hypothetical protein WN944_025647 [Citrus x changshan-huyou]|uniref:EF-hand domain-containing protein n=1 Tax=Citrus x changshan-huyou TaxID=2935761 RepID=A0AAP0LRA0_9ROSI
MKALIKVALAYYNSGTGEEKRLFNKFLQSMDRDGNGRVSYREFSDFKSLEDYNNKSIQILQTNYCVPTITVEYIAFDSK